MDNVAYQFAQSLATMDKVGDTSITFVVSSLIYDSRNRIAKQAISCGADYLICLDSDMQFATDTITKLINDLESGADIVSGLYFKRVAPFNPVVYKSIKGTKAEHYDDYPQNSIFEVDGFGFGCVGMKTEVLYKMALACGNWFEPLNNLGEDLAFCYRAKECGYKLYCDSSIKCGHVGHAVITEEAFKALRGANNVSTN